MGASQAELDRYEALGLDGAIDHLIDYDKEDEGFPVSPWESCFEDGKDEVYLDPYRISGWWALRMAMSQRPLEQKLTLFWHNHFAVGGDKVEFGPAMLSYIETLRKNATGDFTTLLKAVSKEPAMLRYLDTDTSIVGHANENFARELLELFTMGQGHYSEDDVHEAARAFTGWGNRYLIYEAGGDKVQEKVKESIRSGTPMIAFCTTPSLHDSGSKTLLGKTGPFDGDDVLDIVAKRPETAQYICRKLWTFFAYDKPSAEVVNRLANVFTTSQGQIRPVLRAIASSPEFWSDDCIRTKVKSPVDFMMPIVRQMNIYPILIGTHAKPKAPTTPLPKVLRDVSGLLVGSMYQMGMLLLFPPNVSGWDWGTAWISSTNMLQRIKMGDLLMGVGQADKGLAAYFAQQISTKKPATSAEVVSIVMNIFDASLPDAKKTMLATALEKEGGVDCLKTPEGASRGLSVVLRALFSSPEFQHC